MGTRWSRRCRREWTRSSPIGAGDALAAAFTWAMVKKNDFEDAVRWGVAAGTASAKLPGVSFASLEQTEQVYKLVEMREVKLGPG